MSKPRLLVLGSYKIDFGLAEDPDRIKKIVQCDSVMDFKPESFIDHGEPERDGHGIEEWPEGVREVELFAVCFAKKLRDFNRVLDEIRLLKSSFPYLKPAMFPHLAAFSTFQNMEKLREYDIHRVVLTHQNSFVNDRNVICVPYTYCYKECLMALSLVESFQGYGADWNEDDSFLFYRE